MAINPYEPELAKRRTTLQIAQKQLQGFISQMSNHSSYPDRFCLHLNGADEAWKDYYEAASSLAEWFGQKDADL